MHKILFQLQLSYIPLYVFVALKLFLSCYFLGMRVCVSVQSELNFHTRTIDLLRHLSENLVKEFRGLYLGLSINGRFKSQHYMTVILK